jgi:hypothetical protein
MWIIPAGFIHVHVYRLPLWLTVEVVVRGLCWKMCFMFHKISDSFRRSSVKSLSLNLSLFSHTQTPLFFVPS